MTTTKAVGLVKTLLICEGCPKCYHVMLSAERIRWSALHHLVYLRNKYLRPPLKKSLFPVQRMAIIVASREAAKSSFFFFFSPLYRNGQENAGKKRKIGKCEKNMPTRHLKSHPAGGQETKLFLRVAYKKSNTSHKKDMSASTTDIRFNQMIHERFCSVLRY